MRKLFLERRPNNENHTIISDLNEDKNKDIDDNVNLNKNYDRELKKKFNDPNAKRISIEEYTKNAEMDHITILKIIIFLLFLGMSIFALYHVFWGNNGFISQSKRSAELKRLEYIKTLKEQELYSKSKNLKAIEDGEVVALEEEARVKGYIYPDEAVIKIVDEKEIGNKEEKHESSLKMKNVDFQIDNIYLIITIIVAVIIIILSYLVNSKIRQSKSSANMNETNIA